SRRTPRIQVGSQTQSPPHCLRRRCGCRCYIYAFSGSIQQYIERVGSSEEGARCRPATCPQCKSQRPLGCHGFYKRTVVDLDVEYVIRVRRYLCGACRRTVSLLPEFVLPYLRFAIVVIAAFLRARLWSGQTL